MTLSENAKQITCTAKNVSLRHVKILKRILNQLHARINRDLP